MTTTPSYLDCIYYNYTRSREVTGPVCCTSENRSSSKGTLLEN